MAVFSENQVRSGSCEQITHSMWNQSASSLRIGSAEGAAAPAWG